MSKNPTPSFASGERVKVCDSSSPDFDREGKVVSHDATAHTCMVLLDGDTDPKSFSCSQLCCC